MKLNMKVRIKNPWFWVGLGGVILTAMKVSPETLTSWSILLDNLISLVKNPFMLGCVALAVLGVFVDPTTKGTSDSKLAMTYTKPKGDE